MSDCRNERVKLRRRLEKKYKVRRSSVRLKKISEKEVPRIMVTLDLNDRKKDFIDGYYTDLIERTKDFLVKIDYFEDEYCNYTITFLADCIDIGVNKIKMISIAELLNNVVPELEEIYKEFCQ